MIKIALAMIVKGDNNEAILLDYCLESIHNYVDALFITITQKNEAVKTIADKYKANISWFEWTGRFQPGRGR